VNRLVDALLADRQVIDLALQRNELAFDLLADRLDDALLSIHERDFISGDAALSRDLSTGYLPTITAQEWTSALSYAEERSEAAAGWWTVMIPSISGAVGLTVPQDSSEASLVAMFTGTRPNPRTLAYDPSLGAIIDFSSGKHCGPPARGRCGPGTCGQCRACKVWDKTGIGIKCRCPDPGE